MTDLLAATLLILGAIVALIAAVGVLRLPDAFLRMHAATKAGVVGAGLMLLGAGLAFGSAEAWLRVALILGFLLVTVPLSSHALGRAAYLGGAPMWPGSGPDELAGVLPRSAPAEEWRPDPDPSEAHPMPQPAAAPPRRVLLALAQGPESEAALQAGLHAAAPAGAQVTLLSLLCSPSLTNTGPVPLGGAHYAKRLVETRMARAREGAAALATRAQALCEARGLASVTRHEEGNALDLLTRAAAHHDVTVLPRQAWFDQGEVLPPGMADQRALSISAPGLFLVSADFASPQRLHFLHEGDAASGEALKRLLRLGLFGHLPLLVTPLDRPGATAVAADAVALAAAHGRAARLGEPPLHPDHPAPLAAFRGESLAVIVARQDRGSLAWRSLRGMPHSVFLA